MRSPYGRATDNSDTGLLQDRGQRNFSLPAYLISKTSGGDCPAAPKICENWLNPAAFSVPLNTGAGTGFGNIVKDSLRGPRYTVWNAGLGPYLPSLPRIQPGVPHGLLRRPEPHHFEQPGCFRPTQQQYHRSELSQVRMAPDRASGSSHSSSTSDALQLTGTKGGGHFPPPFLFVLVD